MLSSSENKVIFVGLSGVGKTSIINKKQRNDFNIYQEATIGAAYSCMNIEIDSDTTVPWRQERYTH